MINNYLDVTTGHIAEEDTQLLDRGAWPYSCGSYDYGYYVTLPAHEDDAIYDFILMLSTAGFSLHMQVLVAYAVGAGCSTLRLDADGDTIPGLGLLDW